MSELVTNSIGCIVNGVFCTRKPGCSKLATRVNQADDKERLIEKILSSEFFSMEFDELAAFDVDVLQKLVEVACPVSQVLDSLPPGVAALASLPPLFHTPVRPGARPSMPAVNLALGDAYDQSPLFPPRARQEVRQVVVHAKQESVYKLPGMFGDWWVK